MTGLAFLTPEAASESALARTPMERRQADLGAVFERRDGWCVAVGYESQADFSQTVAFADHSHLVKLELQGDPAALRSVAGLSLAPGTASRIDGGWWCPVAPSRSLVIGERTVRDAVISASGADIALTDVTCGLAAMALIGPLAGELLARFSAIDVRPATMPVGGFRPGSVARTPGYVLRDGEQRLLVLVGWAFGEYLWRVVSDAAVQLGGGPVGAEAPR